MGYLQQHYDEIFRKYTDDELKKDIDNFKKGRGRLNKFLNQFFEEEMYKCIGSKYKMSPMDALKDDEIVHDIIEYTKKKNKFYNGTEIQNIKSFLRNGGKYARKVANFPVQTAKQIYWRYFDEGQNIYCLDTSMGFGSRMSAVLLSGGSYCGFDPNKSLFQKLKEAKQFIFENGYANDNQRCGLYCKGSEVFVKELEGLFDVSFTSPPLF